MNKVGAQYAKTREPKDLETLLMAFNNYLMKYVTLLTTGKTGPEGRRASTRLHRDTRRFLSLFASGEKTDDALTRVAARLPNAFISMDADDIYNELAVIFCHLANKFDGRGGFTGFIQHRFAWAVKQRMFQIQRDPMNYQPLHEETPDDEDWENDEEARLELERTDNGYRVRMGSNIDVDEDGYIMLVDQYCTLPELTPAFISCAPSPFDVLWSRIQRAIMVGKFVREMSDSAISDWLGLGGAANVRKEFQQAITSFREFAASDSVKES